VHEFCAKEERLASALENTIKRLENLIYFKI
jgi:hypothetical protein